MDDGGREARFAAYVEQLGTVLGHADRQEPLHDYCLGLLMPIERKSVAPMAAVTAPAQVAAKHQSLLHFVGNAPWSDAAMLAKVSELVLPTIEGSGPIEAWIIDDTGFPKKGRHSVGVSRQYCGQLGKQDNCQVAVSLSLANHDGSLPVAYRLYLPEEWARDRGRRDKAKVSDMIEFQTKPEIALDQIKSAYAAGLPQGVVLMDAGYGNDTDLRTQVTALGLSYVAGIGANTAVWPPGTAPLAAAARIGPRTAAQAVAARRRAPTRSASRCSPTSCRPRSAQHHLARGQRGLAGLALRPPAGAAGASRHLASRAARRGVVADRVAARRARADQILASTMPNDIAFDRLVDLAKLRWRIERDYQELKQELGFGDYEGRGWPASTTTPRSVSPLMAS
jgi:SRSO17 transposase